MYKIFSHKGIVKIIWFDVESGARELSPDRTLEINKEIQCVESFSWAIAIWS